MERSRSVYVLSSGGLDIFAVGPEGGVGMAEITRRTYPPAYGAKLEEAVTVYPSGRGRRVKMVLQYEGLEEPLVFEAKTAEAEAELTPVFDLVRRWARTPRALFE